MSSDDLSARIWEWLPGRTDSRRVTLVATIAVALGAPGRDVAAALDGMERSGHVVRDVAVGRQSGWHRGKPFSVPEPVVAVEEWTLY